MSDKSQTIILCPYCQRHFYSGASLRDHMRMKRKTSASHGLAIDGTPRPKQEIDDAIMRAESNAE
jgi:hypothetical protein